MRAWLERSFRNRIFLTVLLVALVPLLLCDVLMTQVMIFRSEHTLRTDAQEEMALLTTQLDALLTDCGDVTRALAGSTVTRSALRRGGSDSRTLYQLLNRSTVALREYADFEVYGEDGDCLYTTANVWPAAQSTGWGILSAARAADGIVLRAGNGGLAGACPVTARGGAVLGYAVFRMDDANFDAFFAPLLRGADDLLLVDATWRLLYASQPLRADDTLALLRAQLLSGKSLSDGDGERSYYVGACAESGFSLILQQPQTYTAQVVRSIYLVAALMGALCLVLCLVCAWWLSRRLFEPVNELDGAMRRVEGGDYDVRIESTRQDEMGRLAASFDRMTAEYRQNLERSVQRERELNETRLRMLQSQLNPHFLYNTLDCMKWLGVTGGVPQVAELAADLAALLRAGISGSEYITLEEELELIGRYLAIQEVRFGDRFVCELDVDERFQHCVVPKLILQPLVENAIIHGVADSDEGFIKLWAEEDAEGYLLLKVSDNGSGIPPEVLERLNSHELIPGGHLGLNDEAVVRRGIVLGIDWASLGCAVVGEAANGEEGLAAAERYSPNLIITDVRMPHMDGIEMMRVLRERGSTAHVIVLTAYNDFDYARSALRFGAADYLLKPFRDQELVAAIERVREKAEAFSSRSAQDDLLALPKGDKSKYVLQTLEYIAAHYADADINITTIARSIGISEGHLSHVFKKETSYTALGYLTLYRIHMARRLLADCRYKVYEVAGMVGYRDVAYFGSTFKKLTGLSPSEYQDRCR